MKMIGQIIYSSRTTFILYCSLVKILDSRFSFVRTIILKFMKFEVDFLKQWVKSEKVKISKKYTVWSSQAYIDVYLL